MDTGTIGGLIGGVIGIAGGMVGTWFSIRNTSGSKERLFMIRTAVAGWVFITLFLLLFFILPHPYRWLLWIPYGILLPLGIIYSNKTQQKIREQEEQGYSLDSK